MMVVNRFVLPFACRKPVSPKNLLFVWGFESVIRFLAGTYSISSYGKATMRKQVTKNSHFESR